jgi:hypothetical protein
VDRHGSGNTGIVPRAKVPPSPKQPQLPVLPGAAGGGAVAGGEPGPGTGLAPIEPIVLDFSRDPPNPTLAPAHGVTGKLVDLMVDKARRAEVRQPKKQLCQQG